MILKALPQTQTDVNCTREHLVQLSKLYKPGERFKCKYNFQEWECIKTMGGHVCDVTEDWQPEPTKPDPSKLEPSKPE
jgi:hypothetical protein